MKFKKFIRILINTLIKKILNNLTNKTLCYAKMIVGDRMLKTNNILDRVIEVAKNDERVRLVMLNGSRAHKNHPIDGYSDFDVVYYVNNVSPFLENHFLLEAFNPILICQTKDDQIFPEVTDFLGYIYMMQFEDGSRLDLSLCSVDDLEENIKEKDYYQLLLDKDYRLNEDFCIDEKVFTISPPTQDYFNAAVKEFYWLSLYVMKGVERTMVPYAIGHLSLMRRCLDAVIEWYIGIQFGWDIEVGKAGKDYDKYLDERYYSNYLKTFPNAEKSAVYDALGTMMLLFFYLSTSVSIYLNYPLQEDYQKIIRYMQKQSTFRAKSRLN